MDAHLLVEAPKEGGWLRGLHSFSENFGGSNGNLRRKARYGNQWIRHGRGRMDGTDDGRGSATMRPAQPTASTGSWVWRTGSSS